MLPYTVYNSSFGDIIVECESCYIHEVQKTMIEQGYSVREVVYTDTSIVFMRMWEEEVQKDD